MGPASITYEGILAWSILTGTIIRPDEVAALRALDRIWLSEPEKKEAG